MITSLKESIDTLYTVFSNADQPTAIDACPCCISDEEINALLSKPLRDIEPCDLKNYADCAFNTVGELDDFKYFLPRILEILANHTDWWSLVVTDSGIYDYFTKPEVLFSKFKISAEWRKWPAKEQQAIIDFLGSMLDELLQREKVTGWEIDSCMCSLAMCVDDVIPYFQKLIEPRHKHKLREFYSIHREGLEEKKTLDFWWDQIEDSQQEVVIKWLLSANVRNIVNS
jgi:hypothetical protein